jgi:uncharacterized protein
MELKLSTLLSANGPVVKKITGTFASTIAIYAFGSQVAGTAGLQSDLDLAVLVGGYAAPQQLLDTSGELSDMVHCAVDLVDLRAASTIMQYQILTTGVRLWAASGPDAGLYECFILSDKMEFDLARAALINDIRTDGRVYGNKTAQTHA